MDSTTAFGKVASIIKPFVKNTAAFEAANDGTRIIEDLGVNSARLVDIILAFEDEFGIEVDDESADKVRTLGDAVQMIQQKTAAAH
jgi:acyl carrier protein